MSTDPTLLSSTRRDTLIAVVTTDADLQRFRDERWYRLPDRVLGRSLGKSTLTEVEHLAIYQTNNITDGVPGSIELYGKLLQVESMPRRELLPEEPDHPAANQIYHAFRLSEICRLEQPIVSRNPRRVTFIRTRLERLLRASDLSDLIIGSHAEELLVEQLRLHDLKIDRKIYMQIKERVVEVDVSIFAEEQQIGLCYGDEKTEADAPNVWNILRFSPERIENDLEECLREILNVVSNLRVEEREP
ncbi:MAG: hypothetical protein KDD67_01050 [Ignavibacteriae bacterium]|nr:hypothetical protein [Ignavibacteriota bacterium]MCB9217691.1 hypothetical protein [Ignavibacteria bacterium]